MKKHFAQGAILNLDISGQQQLADIGRQDVDVSVNQADLYSIKKHLR